MRYVLVILPILLIVMACGGGSEGPANYSEAQGEKVFKKYCTACHGADGKMQMNGAKDLGLSVLNYADRVSIIKLGKGAMTGFEGILSEEEIAMAAKYSMRFKNQ